MKSIRQLLANLARAGVGEWVVAAGARNLDLVRELMGASDARLWHGFEERSCGFFALGRIQGGAGPVAVVTTSGTAVAELLPAVIEAHYQGLPLVVVSADRPPHFRGSGAPQAIEQVVLMQPYCGLTADLTGDGRRVGDQELWTPPERLLWNRPTHINVCLEEPEPRSCCGQGWRLSDHAHGVEQSGTDVRASGAEVEQEVAAFLARDRPTVALVAGLNGDKERRAVAGWLRRVGLPALWECTAGWGDPAADVMNPADMSPAGAPAHEGLFRQLLVGQVLRIGSVPSWRWWRDLEQQQEIEVLSLSRSGHRGLGRSNACRGFAVDLEDLDRWVAGRAACPVDVPKDQAAARLREGCVLFPRSEPVLLAALNRALNAGSAVFIGNSLPIREWNLFSSAMPARRCHAARGANGIDGQVSNGLGVGSHADEIWVVIGDLTALYDLSAPSWIRQIRERRPGLRVRLVVVNNGGGRIFSRLPSFAGFALDQRKITENTHDMGFEGWARLWDLEYRLLSDAAQVTREMTEALPPAVVLEMRPEETETNRFWDWWQLSCRAAEDRL